MTSEHYNATVISRAQIAPGLIILRIRPDELPYRFNAGQYTVLGLEICAPDGDDRRLCRRAYSIASGSNENEFLEFYLTHVTTGELSPHLCALQPGDRVHVGRKATGMFTLDRVPPDRHVLLVATGTGLAPYVSMLRSHLECGGPRQFVVLHGARYSWDLGYRAELSDLAGRCPNFHYIPAITRPQEDPSWNGPCGYLQDLVTSGIVTEKTGLDVKPEVMHVFLCGNPQMIETARERLFKLGFEPDVKKTIGTLHVEEYW